MMIDATVASSKMSIAVDFVAKMSRRRQIVENRELRKNRARKVLTSGLFFNDI